MKKILIIVSMILASVSILNAQKLVAVNNKIISTELIEQAILNKSKNPISFFKLSKEEQIKLLTTIVKAEAIYNDKNNTLKDNENYQPINGKNFTFKQFYDFRLSQLKVENFDPEAFEINKSLLFYTLWNAQKIKEYSDTIKLKDEEIKKTYTEMKDKFKMPEKRQFAFIMSEKKELITKLIKTFNENNNLEDIIKVQKFFAEHENDKDLKIVYELNKEEGVEKKAMQEGFYSQIWDMKDNTINKKPIEFDNKYFLVYMTKQIPEKQLKFEEVKGNLLLSMKKYEIMKKLNNDIKNSIDKSKIKFFTETLEKK